MFANTHPAAKAAGLLVIGAFAALVVLHRGAAGIDVRLG